ncbi:MAG: Gfo/Idh/MocA family oxidoreductase [Clostridia bacterium]|nr:Gfo/Idh/MocA family oxidoreductase [Clostridia bacterium]
MIRVGLIGAGFMGKMHATCYEALKENGVMITAVADLDQSKAGDIAEKSGALVYETGMELISQADVDAIDICLPTYLHTEHAIAAMRNRKHVFIEKPVCLHEEDEKELLKTEKETGVTVMVGQCIRLWSEYTWLKKVTDSKEYGEIVTGVFKRISPKPTWSWNNWLHQPELSGGVALDMHIHDADFVRFLLGEPDILSVNASRDEEGVIQQMFSTYKCQNALLSSEVCWDYPDSFPFCMEYRVKFDKATAVYNSTVSPALMVYQNDGISFSPTLDKEFESDSNLGGNVSSLGGYYNELEYFINKIKNNEPVETAPLSEGINSVKMVLHEIALAGGTVKL